MIYTYDRVKLSAQSLILILDFLKSAVYGLIFPLLSLPYFFFISVHQPKIFLFFSAEGIFHEQIFFQNLLPIIRLLPSIHFLFLDFFDALLKILESF